MSVWESLADVRLWFQNRRVRRVSLVERGLEKIRLSGRECSRRRPSGDRGSPSRTGLDRKVKFLGVGRPRNQLAAWLGRPCRPQDGKGKFVCPGGSRRRPTVISELPCRTGKPRRATGLKGKVVWPGGSRRRPTGDHDSLCWTGKDRKISCVAERLSPTSDGRKILAVWMGKSRRPWGGKGKVVWPGGSRRRPMGDQDSLSDR